MQQQKKTDVVMMKSGLNHNVIALISPSVIQILKFMNSLWLFLFMLIL